MKNLADTSPRIHALTQMMNTTVTVSRLYIVAGVVLSLVFGGAIGFLAGNGRLVADGRANAPAVASPPAGITPLPDRAFGHWALKCVADARGAKKCNLSIQIVNKERTQLLLQAAVARANNGRPVFVIITPPNVQKDAGVELGIGSAPKAKIGFALCGPGACQAAALFDGPLEGALSAADFAQISYVAANGQTIAYKVPIDGFGDGFAAWQKDDPAPAGGQ